MQIHAGLKMVADSGSDFERFTARPAPLPPSYTLSRPAPLSPSLPPILSPVPPALSLLYSFPPFLHPARQHTASRPPSLLNPP